MENNIKIEFGHICENIIIATSGNLSVINIFNQINATTFPAVHPILFILVGASGEEGEYELSLEIKNRKTGESILKKPIPNKIKIPKPPNQGRLAIRLSPLEIPSAAIYDVVISIGGSKKELFFEAKMNA